MRKSAPLFCALLLSLSARRAWIEIFIMQTWMPIGCVALRKESVDRNFYYADMDADWVRVALRKESVDRNKMLLRDSTGRSGRSPQGERG